MSKKYNLYLGIAWGSTKRWGIAIKRGFLEGNRLELILVVVKL